ncbi:MAG: bifunctional helix-turn-helix domain-containing protein/methylated-DNA--[protein]-cysteine S-methyltransferase [Bauldia sp.]|nr:bifunctional helix-turn-helix domain-containing protein/methylated-DNA--[protein]-cysteine S-methyltransferase [Bauldia sp.]
MNAMLPLPDAAARDYDVVRRVIGFISGNAKAQPSLDTIAGHVGMEPMALQRLFTRWAGLTPKTFLQAVTLDHAKRLLDESASVLDAAIETGLSGPARLHDLFVTHEAMTPGAYKARGAGLTVRWGAHQTPFGTAVVFVTERGLAGVAFADRDVGEVLDDYHCRWPEAAFVEDAAATAPVAARVFDPARWAADRPLRIVLIGTDFEVRVWERLLTIPFGRAATYSDVAAGIGRPSASRAVGAAVGRNPISFVVPCHRVLGKGGDLTGYRWGLTRKRAMLGWETGLAARS